MAFELAGPVVRRSNRVLTGIDLMSIGSRPKSTSDYVKVRVGIRYKGNTDWLGSFGTSGGNLVAGVPISMFDGEKRLLAGAFPVSEVTIIGSPTSLVGSAVTFHYVVDGSSRGARRSLVSVASPDQAVRSVVDQVNASGLGEESIHIQLNDG